jgi:uridine phosphorylase
MTSVKIAKRTKNIQKADMVSDAEGREYHIALASGELAENIILVGATSRAEKAAELLDRIDLHQKHREYYTFTGSYQGVPVSIMSTGMGAGATEIAMVEILQITKSPTIIRVGSCGALQPHVNIGDLVISTGAIRMENATASYVCDNYPAIAHYEVVQALIQSSQQQSVPYHVGLTATAPGFYAAQGRKAPDLPIQNPKLPDKLAEMNVVNFEMEASVIMTLAMLRNCKAGAVCAVYANRPRNEFIDIQTKEKAENNALIVGLGTFVRN